MDSDSFSIVIPVFNQWEFTQRCLRSLAESGVPLSQVILVDNASTDGTAQNLASEFPTAQVIPNTHNRGCAAAWNQGLRASQAPWIIFLNNDTLLPPGWWEGLLEFAQGQGAAIVSPAMRESGDFAYDVTYDFRAFAPEFVAKMRGVVRRGAAHGVCFAVRRGVFERVGEFDEGFALGSHEDIDFFRRAQEAGFRIATTGASFIHHFRAVTRNALDYRAAQNFTRPNRARFRRKWRISKMEAWLLRQREKWRARRWALCERLRTGHSLKEQWVRGKWRLR